MEERKKHQSGDQRENELMKERTEVSRDDWSWVIVLQDKIISNNLKSEREQIQKGKSEKLQRCFNYYEYPFITE